MSTCNSDLLMMSSHRSLEVKECAFFKDVDWDHVREGKVVSDIRLKLCALS